jgi:hypothetical protein
MNRMGWIALGPSLFLCSPTAASEGKEIRAVERLCATIDHASQAPRARTVPLYEYFDDDDDLVHWSTVLPDQDDSLIETGEATIIEHALRRLRLKRATKDDNATLESTYYFRPDGSLARWRYDSGRKGSSVKLICQRDYASAGTLLKEASAFAGLGPGERAPQDLLTPVRTPYRHASDLVMQLEPLDILNEW